MAADEIGLRERKKRQTRQAIVRAALELTLKRGFAATTIALIAERADVAPRTVSLYFPYKDDIVFQRVDEDFGRLVSHLASGGKDLVDRLCDWLEDEAARFGGDGAVGELEHLRHRAIAHDPGLRMRERRLMEAVEEAIALAVASDLGEQRDGLGPRVFAAATLSILLSLRNQFAAAELGATPSVREFERAVAFLRAGLAALRVSG